MRVRPDARGRRGTIVPMLAIACVAMFTFVALAIDLGMLAVARTECQNAADVGALAGARVLNNKPGAVENDKALAISAAQAEIKNNVLYNSNFTDSNITTARVAVYDYDSTAQKFNATYPSTLPTGKSWTGVEVVVTASVPSYFAKVIGVSGMPTGARALAVHRPRDIAMVLDFTGSMGFGSTLNWPYPDPANGVPSNAAAEGLMNPDPAYPKFGHYARYTYYQNTTPTTTAAASSSPSARPNPLQMKGFNGDYAPNNVTMETGGGPPIVEDFVTAPGDPATVSSSTSFQNAFKRWSPTLVSAAVTSTLTPAVYNYSGYNASTGATPAPDNFDTQSDSPIAYVGDKWPRANGKLGYDSTTPWSTLSGSTFTDNGATSLQQFLGLTGTASGSIVYGASGATGGSARDLTKYSLPDPTGLPNASSLPAVNSTGDKLLPTSNGSGGNPQTANKADGGASNFVNYYDVIWESYGYDLDVNAYRTQNALPATSTKQVTLRPAANRFQGYSMGPGYWGKTFFIWPPDPRFDSTANLTSPSSTNPAFDTNGKPMCDWRRRFFLRGDGVAFNPQTDNINNILFGSSAGHVLNTVTTSTGSGGASNTPGYYRINYAAVIAWLKSGPQVLPTNLRAGRILYYGSMPSDLTTGATGDANDKMFLRQYIHYVLGVGQFDSSNAPIQSWTYNAPEMMAGVESRNPFGTLSLNSGSPNTAPSQYKPTGSNTVNNVKPYMNYSDNINRPRQHFWFGPQTMVSFIERRDGNGSRAWWAGTVHETQCWQLKVAVNSCLDDIQYNHPNDCVGEAFFANRSNFMVPMAPMGQDWFTLKNVLFFRQDTVAALKANSASTIEHRPYTATFATNTAKVPNGYNGTDANSGMAIAFNLLSSSTQLNSTDYSTKGRKGAAKIVIFETDGVPNVTNNWSITGTGVDTRYQNSGTAVLWTGDSTLDSDAQAAVAVAQKIAAPVSTSGVSGYSTPTTPARVYSIAFGDLFNGYPNTSSMSSDGTDALRFLLRVQQVGNTSGAGDPPAVGLPPEQVITGPYQRPNPALPVDPTSNPAGRLEKLQIALQRIMQSGVQVTLIE